MAISAFNPSAHKIECLHYLRSLFVDRSITTMCLQGSSWRTHGATYARTASELKFLSLIVAEAKIHARRERSDHSLYYNTQNSIAHEPCSWLNSWSNDSDSRKLQGASVRTCLEQYMNQRSRMGIT